MMAFFAVPISVCITLSGRDIVILALGARWSATGRILQAFGPGIVAMLITAKLPWLHISIGRPDRLLRWNILRFTVTGLLLAAGLRYGAIGVAIASVVSFYLLLGPGLAYAGKPVDLNLRACYGEIFKYFLAGLLSGILGWALFYSKGGYLGYVGGPTLLIRIIASACVVTISYLALTTILFNGFRIHREALALVKNMMPINFQSSPKTS
jgi:PST family polysaccharide transporter